MVVAGMLEEYVKLPAVVSMPTLEFGSLVTLEIVRAKRASKSAEPYRFALGPTPRPSVAPAATVVIPEGGWAVLFKKVRTPLLTVVPPV